MKLIKSSVEILEQGPGMQGVYDMIELCGKTSYKSPVKGGEEAEKFVSARKSEGHLAVLEFGTIYLIVPPVLNHLKYVQNPYSRVKKKDGKYYITTNLRVLIENNWEHDLQWICEPTEWHYKRYTAKIITDRGVTHEIVRHRVFSFCQESTRYCNYSKDKFGDEITIVIPPWCNLLEGNSYDMPIAEICCESEGVSPQDQKFIMAMCFAEGIYMEHLKNGWTPQQARQVLPNALKTEICMCGFEDAWKHFFGLRYYGDTGKPHPSMLEVATMCYNLFKEKGIQF